MVDETRRLLDGGGMVVTGGDPRTGPWTARWDVRDVLGPMPARLDALRSPRDTVAHWDARTKHRQRVLGALDAGRRRPPVTAAQLRERVAAARAEADAGRPRLP